MVRQLRSRSNRRVRRRPLRTKNIIRRVTNIDTGVEFRPSFDQPSWASAPWWPLTLVSTANLPTTGFTGKVLSALVLKSLALEGFKNAAGKIPGFNIRILTVRIWGLNRQPITLDIYDNSTSGCRKLKQLNDRGSEIHYSCLGWRFGKASYAMLNTECSEDESDVFVVSQPTAATAVSVYVQVLIQKRNVPNASLSLMTDDYVLADSFAML